MAALRDEGKSREYRGSVVVPFVDSMEIVWRNFYFPMSMSIHTKTFMVYGLEEMYPHDSRYTLPSKHAAFGRIGCGV